MSGGSWVCVSQSERPSGNKLTAVAYLFSIVINVLGSGKNNKESVWYLYICQLVFVKPVE